MYFVLCFCSFWFADLVWLLCGFKFVVGGLYLWVCFWLWWFWLVNLINGSCDDLMLWFGFTDLLAGRFVVRFICDIIFVSLSLFVWVRRCALFCLFCLITVVYLCLGGGCLFVMFVCYVVIVLFSFLYFLLLGGLVWLVFFACCWLCWFVV